jgi:PIN domain nuclease of toxin-antitoxin system
MTLLLDTHVFLWWLDDPELLSKQARKAIGDGKNIVYISAVVAWEISIKKALGKLDAPDDIEGAMTANRFLDGESLPIAADNNSACLGRAKLARYLPRPVRPTAHRPGEARRV